MNGISVQQRVQQQQQKDCISHLSTRHIYNGCRWLSGRDRCLCIHAITRGDHSPWATVGAAVQPAVLGLLHPHSDHLSPGERQQGWVGGARLVVRQCPHGSSSTTTSHWLRSRVVHASLGRRGCRDNKWTVGVQQRKPFVTAQVRW